MRGGVVMAAEAAYDRAVSMEGNTPLLSSCFWSSTSPTSFSSFLPAGVDERSRVLGGGLAFRDGLSPFVNDDDDDDADELELWERAD